MVKIAELITSGAKKLADVADNPRGEARIFLAHILSCDTSHLLLHGEDPVPIEKSELFNKYISDRMNHKPVAYITGEKEFFGLKFRVNKHTLIPRPETEMIVDEILSSGKKNLLDLCAGSGCIPIAAAKNSDICAFGVDISEGAILVAKQNAKDHGLENNITFEICDIFEKDCFGKFDIITSNPPYITDKDMLSLSPDVSRYEPHSALAGGADGLKFYRRIAEIAPDNLNPGGLLVFEIGVGEADAVATLMEQDFTDIKIKKDLAGIDRMVTGRVKD